MGCFSETCSVSRTPIKYGDHAVLVYVPKKSSDIPVTGFYALDDLYRTMRNKEEEAEMLANDLPEMAKILAKYNSKIDYIEGWYNDYGWLSETKGEYGEIIIDDNLDDQRDIGQYFLVHKDVFDQMIQLGKEKLDRDVNVRYKEYRTLVIDPNHPNLLPPKQQDLFYFLRICITTHVEPFLSRDSYGGEQFPSMYEWDDVLRVHELVHEFAIKKRQDFIDNDYDPEHD